MTDEEAAQLGRLWYLLEQGTKEGLVGSPEEWPGAHCVDALLEGRDRLYGTWHDASGEYLDRKAGKKIRARRYRQSVALRLTPLPALRHLSREERMALVREMVEAIRERTRLRHEAAGTRPLGVEAILSVDPHSGPLRSARRPAPRVHAATPRARRAFYAGLLAFQLAYREAANRLRSGLSASFPPDCFPPSPPCGMVRVLGPPVMLG